MKTIEVAVELAEQLRDWSEPVRVRFVDDPVPMLEFQTVEADYEAAGELLYTITTHQDDDRWPFGPSWHTEAARSIVDAALGGE